MEILFGPATNNHVNIEPSVINEIWLRFGTIPDVNVIVFSPLVPCMLTSFILKHTG